MQVGIALYTAGAPSRFAAATRTQRLSTRWQRTAAVTERDSGTVESRTKCCIRRLISYLEAFLGRIDAILAWEYDMTKCRVAILFLLGLLGCAGCMNGEAQPQRNRKAVVEPQEQGPEPSNIQEHRQPEATGFEPDEAAPQPALTENKDDIPPAETDGTELAEASRETWAEGVGQIEDAAVAEVDEPVAAAPPDRNEVEATEPNDLKAVEPNDLQPVEPSDALPASAGPDDTAASVSERVAPPPSYEGYTNILQTYVRQDGWADYGGLRRRRLEFKPLLMELDELDPTVYQGWSQDEKLAFWINAYNLKMLEIITRNYPIESSWWLRLTWPPSDIRHIKGIWTDYKFIVMDEEFTLAEVERRFFHKAFQDPRVYLAITYACRSSPLLRREVYHGENLDEQLDRQVKKFLASGQGLRIDRRNKVVHLSALFKPAWRGKAFVSRYGTDKKFKERDAETRAALNFITRYLSREDAYFLEVENYTLEYINFDWRLNDRSGGN